MRHHVCKIKVILRKELRQYSLRYDQIHLIFYMLMKDYKLKLPELRHSKLEGRINDPKYCLFHQIFGHSIRDYYILKDNIQALHDANVLFLLFSLKSELSFIAIDLRLQ